MDNSRGSKDSARGSKDTLQKDAYHATQVASMVTQNVVVKKKHDNMQILEHVGGHTGHRMPTPGVSPGAPQWGTGRYK